MKKVDHPNLASVHEVIDVTSDDALLSKFSVASATESVAHSMLTLFAVLQLVRRAKAWDCSRDCQI